MELAPSKSQRLNSNSEDDTEHRPRGTRDGAWISGRSMGTDLWYGEAKTSCSADALYNLHIVQAIKKEIKTKCLKFRWEFQN